MEESKPEKSGIRLSDDEKAIIAQRAGGCYSIVPALRRIKTKHTANRNKDDRVYLQFISVCLNKRFDEENYERLQRQILNKHPYPFGYYALDKNETKTEAKTQKPKRQRKCGLCGKAGHNSRSCKKQTGEAILKYKDGFPRLAPGYDPNPASPKDGTSEPSTPDRQDPEPPQASPQADVPKFHHQH